MESKLSRDIFSVIREIPNMPANTYAAIVQDTKSHCLEILIYEKGYGTDPVIVSRFNVDWTEKEERTDWLAQIIAKNLRESYWRGKANQKSELRDLAQKLFKKLDSSL